MHIHEFRGRVLHAKTAVIDGDWCTVGSSNLDWRSVQLNNELNTVVISAALGQQMEAMFRDDLAEAQPIERRAWSHRSIGERILEWHGRLIEELL